MESFNEHGCNDIVLLSFSFCKQLAYCIKSHSTWKSVFPSWFAVELKELVILKKIFHKKFKLSYYERDFQAFCKVVNIARPSQGNVGLATSVMSTVQYLKTSKCSEALFMTSIVLLPPLSHSQIINYVFLMKYVNFSNLLLVYLYVCLMRTLPAMPFNTSFAFFDFYLSLETSKNLMRRSPLSKLPRVLMKLPLGFPLGSKLAPHLHFSSMPAFPLVFFWCPQNVLWFLYWSLEIAVTPLTNAYYITVRPR